MNTFYPFIHERKKKNIEQLPLYIELIPPIPEVRKPEEEKEKRIIIIELL